MANPPDDLAPVCVQVVYALPERQFEATLHLRDGATVADALAGTNLLERVGLNENDLRCAIFGCLVERTQVLRNGDRIDVLRPLGRDVKETRRALARHGQSMGRGRS
jgi:putative ubiquitin-RnfH superfamily antitoxin RatB of RatAB toxin-antitoxin module